MRAVTYEAYGAPEVLRCHEIPKPTPGAHEVLIKVMATTATAADGMMRRGDTLTSRLILGLRRPRRRFRVMGIELAGIIEAVGPGVTRFEVGERVFGFSGFSVGGYAQYCVLPEGASLAPLPEGLSFGEAAASVDGPTTALYFLGEKAMLRAGERVLVIGASGSVGAAAVQIARHLGARVTGVCSGANRALVESLGAEEVIDYTQEDFAARGETWDVIFDAVSKSTFAHCAPVLSRGGRYLVTVMSLRRCLGTLWGRIFGGKRQIFAMSVRKVEELRQVTQMLRSGALRPVIDRRYPLERVAEAHAYVDGGHKRGNVIIDVPHGGEEAPHG